MTPASSRTARASLGQPEFKKFVVQGIKMTMGVTAAMGGGTDTQYNVLSQVARASSSV